MECNIFNKEFKHYKNDEGKYFCTECCIYAKCELKPKEYKIVTVIGYSICSEKDQFIKKLGRTIAEGRAIKTLKIIKNYFRNINEDIEKLIRFENRQHLRTSCDTQPKSINNFFDEIGFSKINYKMQTVDEFEYEHSASVPCQEGT